MTNEIHVDSDTRAVAETDDDTGEVTATVIAEDGEVSLVGEPFDVERVVVELDRELNREADQQ